MIQRKKKICKRCRLPKYLWSAGYCKECWMILHPPTLKTNYKIRKVSLKQQRRLRRYEILRKTYLKQHKVCQVCKESPSVEIHHMEGRDGENLFNSFLAVCRTCHLRIENEPLWAKENNYSKTRL